MQPCRLRDLARPWGRRSFGLKVGRVAECARGALAQRALKNIHATLWAAGFGAPSGATVVWPQGRAGCGMRPRYPWPKGSKKHSCNPAGCGIWRALGGDGRLASRPGELRTESAVPLAQRALKNIHPTLRAAAFNAPSGATIVWPQGRANCGLRSRYLSPKGLKNIHATLRAAAFNAPSGATIVWPQGRANCGLRSRYLSPKGLKNIHATLRAAGFNAPSGATVVWPQGQASCGLRPRQLGPKGSKKHSYGPAGCGIWRALGGDSRLTSRPSDLRTASAAPWPKGV